MKILLLLFFVGHVSYASKVQGTHSSQDDINDHIGGSVEVADSVLESVKEVQFESDNENVLNRKKHKVVKEVLLPAVEEEDPEE